MILFHSTYKLMAVTEKSSLEPVFPGSMCQRLEAHAKRDRMKFPPEPQGELGIMPTSSRSRDASAVIKEEGIGLL